MDYFKKPLTKFKNENSLPPPLPPPMLPPDALNVLLNGPKLPPRPMNTVCLNLMPLISLYFSILLF